MLPSRSSGRQFFSSLVGCIDTDVALGLSTAAGPAEFRLNVAAPLSECAAAEVVQHDATRFTLSAAGIATCDVHVGDRSMVVRPVVDAPEDLVAHFVADHVVPRIAGLAGLSLHASALAIDDRAFVLIGPSGTGKSTLAARLALEGALLLGDDCAHVRDGRVLPTYRPSRLWPDSAALLDLPEMTPDATGKISASEAEGIVRGASPVRLQEVLVVDAGDREIGVSEALALLLGETLRLVIPAPAAALDQAVEFLRAFGPRRTIARGATLADLRALS